KNEDECEQRGRVATAANRHEYDHEQQGGRKKIVNRVDRLTEQMHPKERDPHAIGAAVETCLLVLLAAERADNAHPFDGLDHEIGELGVETDRTLSELAHTARDQANRDRDEHEGGPGHERQAPRYQE